MRPGRISFQLMLLQIIIHFLMHPNLSGFFCCFFFGGGGEHTFTFVPVFVFIDSLSAYSEFMV